jgi:branched-chain amino acid transport system ATP-binding protein
VPDDRRIFPTLTVARNLAIARKTTRFRAWSRARMLRDLQRARAPAARECENLSGGEMQMVAIARALSARPGWCCSTSRARASRRRSCRTCCRRSAAAAAKGIAVLVVEQNVESALASPTART